MIHKLPIGMSAGQCTRNQESRNGIQNPRAGCRHACCGLIRFGGGTCLSLSHSHSNGPQASHPQQPDRGAGKSDATKAIAYTHEDKLTGSKRWVWGYYTGPVSQQEANTIAMSRCENALTDVKTRQVDGRLLFKFGSKTCELHQFSKDEASTSGQR